MTGNTYRNPTLLAKAITTLDVISQGRAILGVGTGWFGNGAQPARLRVRNVHRPVRSSARPCRSTAAHDRRAARDLLGTHYRTEDAFASPRFRDHIPLLIGGSGERKTFGLAARHFDHLNVIAPFPELPGKMAALARRCEEVSQDPSTLGRGMLLTVVPDRISPTTWFPLPCGTGGSGKSDRIAETIRANVVDVGVDAVIINLPSYSPGSITKLGKHCVRSSDCKVRTSQVGPIR